MTTQEVKDRLKEKGLLWGSFALWMDGQTVGMDESGNADWFEYDVERFINGQSPMGHG